MTLDVWFRSVWFNLIYTHNLIYNACWEDPRVDRVALNLGPHDTLLVITSAGCNVLDYALLAPQHIYAVDMNYRQSALLDLKLAAIKVLDFEQFFAMFGYGCLDDCRAVYETQLRTALSPVSQAYWDRHIAYFSGGGWRRTFYFNGTAGIFARLINTYMDQVAKVRDGIEAMLHAASVAEQCAIYESYLRQALWSPFVRWLVNQDVMLTLLGVPPSQRQQVERHYYGGIVQFIEECVETVFTRLPLRDNYFWRLYMCGAYTPDCCPEYLKRANFERLKAGLAERISVHTSSLLQFLLDYDVGISRFVMLDHMDWLSAAHYAMLQRQWQALVQRALPDTRLLWRSGGFQVDYIDPLEVRAAGRRCRVGDLLTYHHDLAAQLHAHDRVHTYGSFYVADLAVP